MKIKLFILILIICLSCRPESQSFDGVYGISDRFTRHKLKDGYRENLMIKIGPDTVHLYGTVNTWGIPFKFERSNNGDTLYLPNIYKIYRDAYNSEAVILERMDKSGESEHFTSLNELDSLIGKRGINAEKMGKYLQANLIAGRYKFNESIVEFKETGDVSGLSMFSGFRLFPRLGTSWRYESQNNIEANDGHVYRYEVDGNTLILTKYLTYHDEWEVYNVSDEQYKFERIK